MKKEKITIIIILAFIIIGLILTQQLWMNKTTEYEDFEFLDVNGERHHLSDYKGKIILVDFMATWCDPCRLQVEVLKQIWPKYKEKNIIFISISIDGRDDLNSLKNYASYNGISWMIGSSIEAGIKYKVEAIPTTIIFNKDGSIVFRHMGYISARDLENILRDLIEG